MGPVGSIWHIKIDFEIMYLLVKIDAQANDILEFEMNHWKIDIYIERKPIKICLAYKESKYCFIYDYTLKVRNHE